MNATHPAAYLRRSFVDDNSPGDISREAQREAVRRLAAADGHNGDLVEYDDWGVSADVSKAARRTAYARLLADMESGRVSAVYAFDADRLYRDPRDLIRLQDAAQAHRVRIVTTAGPLAIGDGDDPSAEGYAFISAVFGRVELQKAKKRSRAARDARIRRGDDMGKPPFGYVMSRAADGRVIFVRDPAQQLDAVLDTFAEVGSFSGAARRLNELGVRSGEGRGWSANAVIKIVRRERPDLAPKRRGERRVAPRGAHRFSRLLRCPCGRIMTPKVSRQPLASGATGSYTSYQCFAARYDREHSRPYMISESAILAWAQAEAAYLHFDDSQLVRAESDAKRRAELQAQRERLGWALADGLLDREQAAERAAAIDAEIVQLDDREIARDVPPSVHWAEGTPPEINDELRSLWRYIELGRDLRPVRAAWRDPSLRKP